MKLLQDLYETMKNYYLHLFLKPLKSILKYLCTLNLFLCICTPNCKISIFVPEMIAIHFKFTF